MNLTVSKQLEKEPNLWINKALTVMFVIAIMIWAGNTVVFNGVKENGIQIAKNVVDGILHPNTSMLFTLQKGGVPALLLETICIALLGTLIGSLLAVPLAFLASSNIVPKWVSTIALFFIAAIRTFPAFVYGLM
ncbi:MAG: PhnE/PtxC family ABC transporter permease, partial [Peptostreptococcaceae bacterium]